MIKRVKMLFVEENEQDRAAFQRMVVQKHLPYDLTTVRTLSQARVQLKEARFDTVVADYHLPDGESTELFDQAPDTPFILLTGTPNEELALRKCQREVDDYLAKDAARHHLDVVPLAVERTLHRSQSRDIEQRLARQLGESREILEHKLEELETTKEHLAQQNAELVARRAEVEQERRRYQELFDLAPDAYLVTNLRGRVQEVNEAACRLFRQDRDTLVQMLLPQLIVLREDRQRVRSLLSQFRENPAPEPASAQVSLLTPGREQIKCALTLNAVQDPMGQVMGLRWQVRDISGQKRAQELAYAQERRQTLLNEVATDLLSAEALDQMVPGIFERIAQYFRVDAFAAYRMGADGRSLELESCGGLSEEVRQRLRRVEHGRGLCYSDIAAQERKPILITHVQLSQDPHVQLIKELGLRAYYVCPLVVGGRLLGTLAFGSRQRDSFEPADQEFFQALGTYQAIAKERVALLAELRRHAGNLEQTVNERTARLQEAMAEMQHMSYSMMHDLRAPLRAMHAFATILQEQAAPRLTDPERDYLQRIVRASNRMDLLVTDALNYNKAVREELMLAQVDTDKLLRGMLSTYPEFQPPLAEVRVEGRLPPVLGNEAALTQCFSQFLDNAVKFVPAGAKPRVRVRAEHAQNAESALQTGDGQQRRAVQSSESTARDGPASLSPRPAFVRLWFEDNGTGIPKEGRQKIFDMFQRMHGSDYPGTGIGLALVRKLVERMKGRVGVESEVGQGSRFWVELKAAA